MPLSFLLAGEKAEVGQVLGQPELVHRLQELGLRHGSLVEMISPGCPCIIRFGGQKFCFRGDELTSVLVLAGVKS